jgi:hypothetical protein
MALQRTLALSVALAAALVCAGCSQQQNQELTGPAGAPAHIETWAYVDACHGVGPAETSVIRQWVSFAETKCAVDHTLANAVCHPNHCTSIAYIDPNLDWSRAGVGFRVPSCTRPDAGGSGCGNEQWFVHKPGFADLSHRLTWTNPAWGSAYLLNGGAPSVDRFVARYVHRRLSAYDGLMVDDVGASVVQQLYGDARPIYTASAELRTNAQVQRAHVKLARSLGSSFLQVDNTLTANPYVLPVFTLLNHPASVVGVIAESYPENGSAHRLASWYSTGLDDIAYLETTPELSRDFVALLGYSTNGSLIARRVQEATVMLGYEPHRVVDWPDLNEDERSLIVWPEEGLYFERPLQTMGPPSGARCMNGLGGPCSGGHADLEVAHGSNAHEQRGGAGVYRREFRQCYYRGAAIGGCAAVMNDTNRAVVVKPGWFSQRYGSEIEMDGGEVEDGGGLTVDGTKFTLGATKIGPDDAALLSQ